jgi:hypothetical protein
MSIPNVPILFTMDSVSSQPAVDRDQHDVIHLGGESAVVLPRYGMRAIAVFVPLCTARYARPE